MTRPESLCARVLKGRYFHDSEFMECTRRKKASHTWRAILAGRDVLKAGLISRIGDGSTTRIWEDRWIPKHFCGKPIAFQEEHDLVTVQQLMTGSGQWNEELMQASFLGIDVDAILRTPLRGSGEDIWAWEHEKHGCYSVRSAYKLLDSRRQQEDDVATASSSSNAIWHRVWKLAVPPKVKIFWWRVVNGFLPAKQVLHHRHIEPMAICDTCGNQEESIRHVLLECTIARSFWEQIKEQTGMKIPVLHPGTWAKDILVLGTEKERAIIICGMWSLWMHRNDRHHGKAGIPVAQAVVWVRDTTFDLWQILHPPNPPKARREAPRWAKPEDAWVKCNVDAAFQEETRRGASGMVLRNDQGAFVGAQATAYPHCLDALTVEAYACRDGMSLAERYGINRLHIETDCHEFGALWESRDDGRSVIAPIIMEICELKSCFQEFRLSYASRLCNKVAHVLAKQVTGSETVVWQEAPLCVHSLLLADCNPSP
jgi:hypothetical protein